MAVTHTMQFRTFRNSMIFGIFGIPVRHGVCQGPGAVGLVRALWLLRERERARERERESEREREDVACRGAG